MVRFFLLLTFLFTYNFSQGQIEDPVHWTFSKKHISANTWQLVFDAEIEPGWYVYSQHVDEGGPVPTSVNFEPSQKFTPVGEVEESGNKKEGFDKTFEMQVVKYFETLQLTQKIEIEPGTNAIEGYVEFMTCNDGQCLPPTPVDFSFTFEGDDTSLSSTTSNNRSAHQENDTDSPQEAETSKKENANEDTGEVTNPVIWKASVVESQEDGSVELSFYGEINEGWYLYSSTMSADLGPIPTMISYDQSDITRPDFPLKENGENVAEEYDPIFEVDVVKVKNNIELSQPIFPGQDHQLISGKIEYMATSDKVFFPEPIKFEYNVKEKDLIILNGGAFEDPVKDVNELQNELQAYYKLDPKKLDHQGLVNCLAEGETSQPELTSTGNGKIFFLGFLGGLIALLTPCVFPMIPLTVSFFTKSGGSKSKGMGNALLYGGFIFLIYFLLSVPFHFLDSINPDILNNISTNVVLNIAFFLIFIFFAFSFFGYYELTLPSSWSNKVSKAEGLGGILGIFFMALTLALVSFSCTGPILGSLLAGSLSSDGGAMQLTAGMSGFGLALALPFGLFAAFPSIMQKLPRSGSWMNTVKVVMGFLELGLAFKFLSNADLVKHWGLLKIEPFLIIWILISLGLALYLFGIIKFPHDSKSIKISLTRKILGIISVAFAVYLMTGFRYNESTGTFTSLKLLSGLAPPVGYSWIYPNECPNNIDCFKDLRSGMQYAKENNLPIMLDFTGYACVNCRKMEEHVWPDPGITKMLKDEYVLISLYVDDREVLDENEQITLPKHNGGERTLLTVGDKWQFFQTEFFRANTQPLYALVSPDGKILNKPIGYTPQVKNFKAFLQCGLENFKSNKNTMGLNTLKEPH